MRECRKRRPDAPFESSNNLPVASADLHKHGSRTRDCPRPKHSITPPGMQRLRTAPSGGSRQYENEAGWECRIEAQPGDERNRLSAEELSGVRKELRNFIL